ncbi:MAG: hypothetical protein IJ877_08120 [Candidatus Gastranaerophilales bacterium]|nr:hypothetical protein [Candidatus Gastranaerophilales bacterium]
MSESVTNNTNNVKPTALVKGGLIGAGIGAAIQAAYVVPFTKAMSQDEFIKRGVENIKNANTNQAQEVIDAAVEYFKKGAEGQYKDYLSKISELKKQLPGNIGKAAIICAGVGLAIGGVVYLVKKGKAKKQQKELEQQNKQIESHQG